jgi:hypothetical protein
MANTDRFIEEVTEEVRKDRLFGLMRRWGWVAVLIVLLIVGAAAWTEWQRAKDRAAAEALGDALITALDLPEADDRLAALASIPTNDAETSALLILLQAAEEAAADQPELAAARLRTLASIADLPTRYRDLAILKAHLLAPAPTDEAMAQLEQLALPGGPFRALAMEQQAFVQLDAGNTDRAREILERLQDEPQATPGLQQRAMQLIVTMDAGSIIVDEAPIEDDVVRTFQPVTADAETVTPETATTEPAETEEAVEQ